MEILRYYFGLFFVLIACSRIEEDYSSKAIIDAFWKELQTSYAYPDRLEAISVAFHQREQACTSMDEKDIALTLGKVLSQLHDGHAHVYTPWGVLGNEDYFESFYSNVIDDYTDYFESYEILNSCLRWGKVRNYSLNYLYVRSFDGDPDNFDYLDSLVAYGVRYSDGWIIDVRGNRGGLLENSLHTASFFLPSVWHIGKFRRCVEGKHGLYTSWTSLNISPARSGTYLKPVVVLTDRFTFSAAEWFVMAIANLPHVTVVGDTTGGGISIPVIHELPNGWLLSIPNTQFLSSEGIDFQFSGYPPDIPVILSPADKTSNRDTPLEYAIRCLMAKR